MEVDGDIKIGLISLSILVLLIECLMYIHPKVEVGRYIQILGISWIGFVSGNKRRKDTSTGRSRRSKRLYICVDGDINMKLNDEFVRWIPFPAAHALDGLRI